ncbi:hypothetical protein [Kozakia baliensis]|uniref:Uncharacterized protein n=1 Tax=Kozakia baliensis TaxID=153496 RepID=A0A1D8UVW9_9PROT|nr:hypothetical protein [Kozakia baliensis]AOX17770.1 hypothetical protein A0U89_12170 [Kozakia baliensis]GBR23833.1 hypothetical protein AA0488_0237 [Kozakia baliensis NRIC 0488]GEL65588.1 hypothetical protein KBA01_28740 [Kozakia baliensis]
MPVQFVLKGAGSLHALADAARIMLADARKSRKFSYIDDDLRFDRESTGHNHAIVSATRDMRLHMEGSRGVYFCTQPITKQTD